MFRAFVLLTFEVQVRTLCTVGFRASSVQVWCRRPCWPSNSTLNSRRRKGYICHWSGGFGAMVGSACKGCECDALADLART